MFNALVIGSGIAGLHAALELGNMGIKVYLVEQKPCLGGGLAYLCGDSSQEADISFLVSKLEGCYRHKNITVLPCSELKEVKGKSGHFQIKIVKHPRYVDAKKCKNTGECVKVCPVKLPSGKKAIDFYYPQCVPHVPNIEPEHCLYLTKGNCGLCQQVCPHEAVNYKEAEEELSLEVSAIILATGCEEDDPSEVPGFGYGKFKGILTARELERLLNDSSEGIFPLQQSKCIAFAQCVGIGQLQTGQFCSAVCCQKPTDQAVRIKKNYPETKIYIFYGDQKLFSSCWQETVEQIKSQYDINYIGDRAAWVTEEELGKLVLHAEKMEEGKFYELAVDMVILGVALVPSKTNVKLAKILGVEIDRNNFFKTNQHLPFQTSREGIFACGYCNEPVNAVEAVNQATGAAASAAELIFKHR